MKKHRTSKEINPDSRLLARPRPYSDESLPSYVKRVEEANFIPHNSIVRDTGLHERALASLPFLRDSVDILAQVLDTDQEIVAERLYISGSLRYAALGAIGVDRTDIVMLYRRFSPTALKRSPYHRMIWDLRYCVADPETGELLLERCSDCEARVRWDATSWHKCEVCNLPLVNCTPLTAPSAEVEFSRLIAALLTGKQTSLHLMLQKRLRSLALPDLIQLMRHLGLLALRYAPNIALSPADPLRCGVHLLFSLRLPVETIIRKVIFQNTASGKMYSPKLIERLHEVVPGSLREDVSIVLADVVSDILA